MKPPEIYESDYHEAVRKVHRCGYVGRPIRILVRTTKFYDVCNDFIHMDDLDQNKHVDVFSLTFNPSRPDVINGYRTWSLQDKITIAPDCT